MPTPSDAGEPGVRHGLPQKISVGMHRKDVILLSPDSEQGPVETRKFLMEPVKVRTSKMIAATPHPLAGPGTCP